MGDNIGKRRKEKIILAVLLSIGALYAFFEFFLMPSIDEISTMRKKVQVEKENLERIRIEAENIELPQRRFIQRTTLEEKMDIKKLPYVMDVPGLFVEFYYLFIVNELQSDRITFGNPTHTGTYSYFNMVFDIRGKTEDIERFIVQLENFRRLLSIEQMSLRIASAEELSLSLTLRVYFYRGDRLVKEPSDYDFVEGRYGVYENFMDILRNKGT
jgi:Tfp pilus assembly protein PilO